MASNFRPNSAGLREYLMSGDLYPALEQHAKAIEARVRANAAQHVRTGAYEASIHTERQRGRDRVRVRVIADDEKADILEARYNIFGRAVE